MQLKKGRHTVFPFFCLLFNRLPGNYPLCGPEVDDVPDFRLVRVTFARSLAVVCTHRVPGVPKSVDLFAQVPAGQIN